MRNISILGSTGSIGTSTLDVIRRNPNKFSVSALAANKNINLLAEQIAEFSPKIVCVNNEELSIELKSIVSPNTAVLFGDEGLFQVATYERSDIVMSAITGAAGIVPTIKAIEAGKDIAIANKETLVAAGELVTRLAKQNGSKLIPVDSEHSAIFQSLNGERHQDISKLILTASGGAFREKTRDEMEFLKSKDALQHPNWSMGEKVTIDCATLMNKGFEVMEAHWLFNIPYENIEVLIHKESTIHSMVEFVDGSIIAQLGVPDMRLPIQYSLQHPERISSDFPRIDFKKVGTLHFEEPDFERFPCLRLAYYAGKEGGTLPTVLNASNEIANELFRQDKIGFLDIEKVIYNTLEKHKNSKSPELETILEVDRWARSFTMEQLYTL
ncbi:1-deoxy-D-xylulose-5-phosphate reductoisomerase [Sutcliffiella horikoshii]|uniref:1-deoxy-D-xylulose-5-phosphate reductoisomerase n=1 Tax=Sutcliffiella horikoshii TaxID=79883 RepID=UPI0020402D89|nr:1-deoxy-D-xylulose-5-phosphate reductoisomerase [Sutcliffiella horikoshii]MCM3617660.1 1-deoxy-D-xylulose-5-phosphate reductoisomerase [Sutcliffiella horikoshii]